MNDKERSVEKVVRRMLVPLARLLIGHGINARMMVDMVKLSFVEAASWKRVDDGKTASISQTSRRTGLTRKEVRNLRERLAEGGDALEELPEAAGAPETSILGYWVRSRKFLDNSGKPRALKFGPGPGTFAELVKEAWGSESAMQHLENLMDRDCVEVEGDLKSQDHSIRLIRRSFLHTDNLAQLLEDGLATLAQTLERNCTRDEGEPGFVQRIVFCTDLDPDKVFIARAMIQDRAMQFVEDLDDQLGLMSTSVEEPFYGMDGTELRRLGLGVYYFETEK